MKKMYLFVLSVFLFTGSLFAQVSKADFDRVEALRRNTERVYNDAVSATWIGNTSYCYYVNREKDGMKFYLVNAETGRKTAAFDQQRLAAALSKAADTTINAFRLPFRAVRFAEDVRSFTFDYNNYEWEYIIRDNRLNRKERLTPPAGRGEYWGARNRGKEMRMVHSPDSLWTAMNRDNNMWLRNRKTGEETQLSFNGAPGDYYSSAIIWSPDSKKIAAMQVREATEHLIYFVESSPRTQLQPILHSRNYYKPGDALPISRPRLFDVDSKKQVPVDAVAYENQYAISEVRWWKDSRAFTFEFNQRGHQVYQVVEVNAATGATRIIVDEQCKTFFDYSGKKYRYDFSDGKEMIWRSERDGWNHLYLYDVATGRVKNQITKGNFVVRTIEEIDEKNRQILFTANGYDAEGGEDPYNIHLFRVNMDGTGLTKLTTEQANHRFTFSGDKKFFVDVYARPDMPPVSVLRRTSDGRVLAELEKADISELLATGWKMPEVFRAKGRDGVTDIWGTIFYPTNFDPNKKYPIVESIYAGPHGSHVQKNFVAYSNGFSRLADLGCIIVSIDGMGTSNRSKAFHDVCWQNLKDAGFPDRILWMKAAAATRPFMDLDRVGVFGTSAGGQNAMGALLFHGDFYKVASASCGCHDNRMDKIWWNEQWMGFPIGKHYEESSNVVNAHLLQGKLLLMVGEVDDNVDPASTMQVVDALIKARKEFDLIVLPGLNHTGGGEYGMWRMHDFFVRNLFGQATPDWNKQ